MEKTSLESVVPGTNNETERAETLQEQSAIIAKSLLGAKKDTYGEHYNTHLLEQYKKYLEMADKISDRRSGANTFFLTVNTGLISAFGIAKLASENTFDFLFVTGSIAAILLCYSWYRLIRSYQDLNTAKFKVVHEIENYLPIRPYDAEWEAVGRGKNKQLYFPFTNIERLIPWIFIGLYIGVILFTIYCLYK